MKDYYTEKRLKRLEKIRLNIILESREIPEKLIKKLRRSQDGN